MKTRKLTDHQVNGLNDALEITVLDGPGPGGANHVYQIAVVNGSPSSTTVIAFQNGPIKEAGFNGISAEALLAVLIDRTRGFQFNRHPTTGEYIKNDPAPYACDENANALFYLESALMWFQKRTRERMNRGVEGTHKA